MKIVFSEQTWDDDLYWQKLDRKLLARIHALIWGMTRSPFEGAGTPVACPLWRRSASD
ncbi:MAG: type II toxin-antitoxin system YoeB family toxin [Burkholderiales bacterium]|nr:type II toxin-antitoxin system YoeB family toxin [Burkholderiales bacterium]MBK8666415.1 type II toxin-antitoxin system YoeB family toxin [Burkholderiales bacterium]